MNFLRLNTEEEVKCLLEFHNSNSSFVTLDCETTSVNPREAVLIDVQISGRNDDEAVIFSADKAALIRLLKPKIILVGHSYKYDAHVLFRHGVNPFSHTWRDTLLLGHLLDENRESYSLDSYVKEFYNDDYKEKFWTKYKTYEEASEEDKTDYACRDVVYTTKLYRHHTRSFDEQNIDRGLIEHVHRLQNSLIRTEIEGIAVDLDYTIELGTKLQSRITEIQPQMRSLVKDEIEICELEAWEKEIYKRKTDKGKAGVPRPSFSFESSSQLSNLLYNSLRLPEQRNEKTKAISTDFDSLERIKGSHPVVSLIQENRELQKVYGAYIKGTLERVQDGRIYPSFRVNGTVTGRISHSNPNLAQLPKEGGVRGIYIPNPGCRLISADYKQLEVVIEANLTRDKSLIRMLENGESKHDITCNELGISRDLAKPINFAMQYRATHYKIAKLLGVSESEGLAIWKKYWTVYAGCRAKHLETDSKIDKGEHLTNLFGRKRRFANRKRSSFDKDYRQGYNFLIQSTGSDLTSRAFYLMSELLEEREWGRALYTVHDELLIEVKALYVEEASLEMLNIMTLVGEEVGLAFPVIGESSGPMLRWED